MADLGVFSRYKSFGDYQQEEQKNSLAAALTQAKLSSVASGGSLPAPIQVANEMFKLKQLAEDNTADPVMRQQAGTRYNLLGQAAKTYGFDRGTEVNFGIPQAAPAAAPNQMASLSLPNAPIPQTTLSSPQAVDAVIGLFGDGNNTGANGAAPPSMQASLINAPAPAPRIGVIPGFADAASVAPSAKKRAETQAVKDVELGMNPRIKFNEKVAEGAGAAATKNAETLGNLVNMKSSIQQAKELIPQVAATGPILGRTGALAEDPQYRNLQGAINAVVLQAKDLYNLGSGQGFTDADRNFLQEVIAGKYSRAETIQLGLDRMDKALDNRASYLAGQSNQYNQQYGGTSTTVVPKISPVEAKAKAGFEAKKSGIKEGSTATNPATGQKITYRNGQWQ